MSTSVSDLVKRLKQTAPPWFGDLSGAKAPVWTGFLTGPATMLAWYKDLVDFVQSLTRLSTMTGGWLDLFAQDFFGDDLLRETAETDASYRDRIKNEFFKASNTQAAILAAIAEITSVTPNIIEWWRCDKTGAWGHFFWNVSTTARPFRWASPGIYFEIAVSDQETRRRIFVALRRYKAEGIVIMVKFTS